MALSLLGWVGVFPFSRSLLHLLTTPTILTGIIPHSAVMSSSVDPVSASASAGSVSPPPLLLLSLPHGPASLVLQCLEVKEARRFVLTTSVAVRNVLEGPLSLAFGSKAWFRPAKRLLDRFEPGILYFESWARCRPRRAYKRCKNHVKRMLERAGLQGTDWEWTFHDRAVENVEAVLPAGCEEDSWNYARLSSFLQATKCDACKRYMAKGQCAPCGKLLCPRCQYSCDGDVHGLDSRCPFAMCPDDYEEADPFLDGFYDSFMPMDDVYVQGEEEKPVPALTQWTTNGELLDPDDVMIGVCPHHRDRAGRIPHAALAHFLNDDDSTRRKRLVGGQIVRASQVQG
jgi:hypothetical protein